MILILTFLSFKTEFIIKESFTKEENYVKGTMFLNDSNNLCFIVTNPLLQIVTFKAETTILYYPNDKKAFYLTGISPMDMPMNKSILQTEGKTDLSVYGMRFIKEKKIKDTTIVYWALPQRGFYLDMKKIDEKIKRITIRYKKLKIGEIIYDNYYEMGKVSFPQYIKTVTYTKKDSIFQEILFSNTKTIEKIPDSLINLKIPPDVEVKK